MIYSDSRYAKGPFIKAQDARHPGQYNLTAYRTFPTNRVQFYNYTWVEGDRIDVISHRLLGSPYFWWKIMDFNPEYIDPFSIPAGATIRIPSA